MQFIFFSLPYIGRKVEKSISGLGEFLEFFEKSDCRNIINMAESNNFVLSVKNGLKKQA
jgi:hypothetical protein